MLKALIKKIVIPLVVLVLLAFLLFSRQPAVSEKPPVTPAAIKEAANQAQDIHRQLFSSRTFVELKLSQRELDSITTTATHMVPGVKFDAATSRFGLRLAASMPVELGPLQLHLNASCMLLPQFDTTGLEGCKLGHIPIPGGFAEWGATSTLGLVFGEVTQETFSQLIEKAKFYDGRLVLSAIKSQNLKGEVKQSINELAQVARSLTQRTDIPAERIKHYLDFLRAMDNKPSSLAYYMGQAIGESGLQVALDHDPRTEATAALWALSIKFGTKRFARLANITESYNVGSRTRATLRGREDLALHFLYTLMIEQLGKANVAYNVAELKELLDTNAGGSGYSFPDLAAGQAGLAFSELLSGDKDNLVYAQNLLAYTNDESLFFPFVHDLPEGYKQNQFVKTFGSINSKTYKQLEQKIFDRVAELPIFNTDIKPVQVNSPVVKPIKNGQWLIVDTHTHTKFSDGQHTVAELAQNAKNFGCDVLAITDHADKNLSRVTSEQYFRKIQQAHYAHSDLTVMAGIEWNTAPFMGREHVTLLLPDSPQMAEQYKEFRRRFDSYGRRSVDLISAEPALRWLNKINVGGVKPIVMYNHPSRKSQNVAEAYHDMASWRSYNDIVIGFSGAPGHQKLKGPANGSYRYKIKTVGGWDPVASTIGGVWDQLLADGHNVWSARAPSDFHETRMDYWPCQFSTTHLYSKSARHNDVLTAYRAGNFWAQHGRFVEQLSFDISTKRGSLRASMGETLSVSKGQTVQVNIQVLLRMFDWENRPTSLDELELITVTPFGAQAEKLPLTSLKHGILTLSLDKQMSAGDRVFRLRGTNRSPKRRSYSFYSNPIRVRVLN